MLYIAQALLSTPVASKVIEMSYRNKDLRIVLLQKSNDKHCIDIIFEYRSLAFSSLIKGVFVADYRITSISCSTIELSSSEWH